MQNKLALMGSSPGRQLGARGRVSAPAGGETRKGTFHDIPAGGGAGGDACGRSGLDWPPVEEGASMPLTMPAPETAILENRDRLIRRLRAILPDNSAPTSGPVSRCPCRVSPMLPGPEAGTTRRGRSFHSMTAGISCSPCAAKRRRTGRTVTHAVCARAALHREPPAGRGRQRAGKGRVPLWKRIM